MVGRNWIISNIVFLRVPKKVLLFKSILETRKTSSPYNSFKLFFAYLGIKRFIYIYVLFRLINFTTGFGILIL